MTGIPIRVVLKKYIEQADGVEKHKFHEVPMPDDTYSQEGDLASEKDYLKSIEKAFADQAEGILDRLQLSHLCTKPKKKANE